MQKDPERPRQLHSLCLGNGRRVEGGGWGVNGGNTVPKLANSLAFLQRHSPAPSDKSIHFPTTPKADVINQLLIPPVRVGHLLRNEFFSDVDSGVKKPGF